MLLPRCPQKHWCTIVRQYFWCSSALSAVKIRHTNLNETYVYELWLRNIKTDSCYNFSGLYWFKKWFLEGEIWWLWMYYNQCYTTLVCQCQEIYLLTIIWGLYITKFWNWHLSLEALNFWSNEFAYLQWSFAKVWTSSSCLIVKQIQATPSDSVHQR